MDGLCDGVAAMASAFFAMLCYQNGQTIATTLAAAVLGAATVFLRWNFKPAKIFMGDGGAMFLGFFFQAEDGIRDYKVTGVQTCALPISPGRAGRRVRRGPRSPTRGPGARTA